MTRTDPAEVIQRQLEAYNARDIDGWLSTFAPEAEQYTLHGGLLARGHEKLRRRMAVRFAEPDLHARLISRVTMAQVVVDLERVTRTFPDGKGTVEMLCIYEVVGGHIVKASYALGAETRAGAEVTRHLTPKTIGPAGGRAVELHEDWSG